MSQDNVDDYSKNKGMTVVFFFPNILRDAHNKILQLDRLKHEGFNLILLDATSFYGNTATATEEIILENRLKCSTTEDFNNFRENLPQAPVLFIAFDLYTSFAAPVLDIIIRKKDKLLTYFTKRFSSVHSPSGIFADFLQKCLPRLHKALPLNYFKSFYRWKYNMYIPDYYLCSTNFLIPPKIYLSVKKNNIIVVHADDINQIISDSKSYIDPQQKVGVFLDQGVPFLDKTHPTLYKEPIPDEYRERYYYLIEKTLQSLKDKMDLDEIVIALHPDAVKFEKELEGKFSLFRTFIGATKDLVRDAHVVFGHSSTAFSFAIFHKKPLIILTDDFLMEYHYNIRKSILFFADELGMKILKTNEEITINSISEVPLDLEKYEDYTRKYLKDNEIQENSYFYAIKKIEQDLRES